MIWNYRDELNKLLSTFFSLYENHFIEVSGVLFTDVLAFEMPWFIWSTLDSYLNGVMPALAVDVQKNIIVLSSAPLFVSDLFTVFLEVCIVLDYPLLPITRKCAPFYLLLHTVCPLWNPSYVRIMILCYSGCRMSRSSEGTSYLRRKNQKPFFHCFSVAGIPLPM